MDRTEPGDRKRRNCLKVANRKDRFTDERAFSMPLPLRCILRNDHDNDAGRSREILLFRPVHLKSGSR